MNLELSSEQTLLRKSARAALKRTDTVAGARAALENPADLPELWPTSARAGWPGLWIDEDHGGVGLGLFEAMLIAEECGRVLAPVALVGLLPATSILNAAGHPALSVLATGELRAVWAPARPPGDLETAWTVEPRSGMARAQPPRVSLHGDQVSLDGDVAWVPELPGADLIVVLGVDDDGAPVAVALPAGADGVDVEPVIRYDSTRPLGHLRLRGARGTRLAVAPEVLVDAWYCAHALIAAESLGTVAECLERSVAYAQERFTFGRAIGSYQAIKHELVEVLRRMENTRGLTYYAGWARDARPDEFALAASAARAAAGDALDFATRSMINVHGGIGATWDHDAPLFFRRGQLSRRLLGGTRDAVDRVAERALAAHI